MRAASDILARLRQAFVDAGGDAFLEIVDAASPASDLEMRLATWACRTLTALAFEADESPDHAAALRSAPAVTPETATDWEQRLREHVDRLAASPEVAQYEGQRFSVTILDEDHCELAIATAAAATTTDLPAVHLAARLVRQLVGPAVLDFDHWRERSFWLPTSIIDPEVDTECERSEQRYTRFFATAPRVLASLAELLRA